MIPINDCVDSIKFEKARTGNYGEEAYGIPDYSCNSCGCDLRYHNVVYDFKNKLLCEDCYRDALFDEFCYQHETTLEDYYE